MKYLNLGILAHVDAGKTSLTERLLYTAGVIDEIGSVDAGNTQTDSLQLERRRGITIKSAVASFDIGDTRVNLIDTPGHPDFIAEVERVLSVLDGVVLVISAVEGVQPQTRILMRALQRLRIPTIIFVNKIDRMGARYQSLLEDIALKLGIEVESMGTVINMGQQNADFQADIRPRSENVTPVFFGSAITGAGIQALMGVLPMLLPAFQADSKTKPAGTIFKIERGPRGEKIAYLRLLSGTVNTREKLVFGKVMALRVFMHGQVVATQKLSAGEIGKVWGLEDARVGDSIGDTTKLHFEFAPPTLEAVVVAKNANQQSAIYNALKLLAEQDPLINLRQSNQTLFVSLYGEVQKEVIATMLAHDFGVEAAFERTQPICIERPAGVGYALQRLQEESNPTSATIGLRIEPGNPGSGIVFKLAVQARTMPLHIYKNTANFAEHMTHYTQEALRLGLHGLMVTDCVVTMTNCDYYVADGLGKPISETPKTTAADFRKLTPTIIHTALQQAGTIVCQPICFFVLEVPIDALAKIMSILARLHVAPSSSEVRQETYLLKGYIPSASIHDLQQQLPNAANGEGFLDYEFDRYEPVA